MAYERMAYLFKKYKIQFVLLFKRIQTFNLMCLAIITFKHVFRKYNLVVLMLDFGKQDQHFKITFYFFENNVLDTEVAIEKLNIVTP